MPELSDDSEWRPSRPAGARGGAPRKIHPFGASPSNIGTNHALRY